MSLPAGQHHVLKQIEGKLGESDPRLVSLFVTFGRLTRGEAMPWVEHIKPRPVADRVGRLLAFARRLPTGPAARARAVLLLPAALAALMCGLVIAIGFPGTGRSAPAKAPAARELVVKTPRCWLPMVRFPAYATC